MAIKVQFEIGHTATVKTKRTPEGFTHDWELYVQGVNKADISAFVDKVVFNLHDSFPRPKRSIKEPPYVIKESGYAGFVLNIDIYFRNRDEPKRVTYVYDLDLQHEGPPYHRCEIKKFIFEAPSEDFRQKLVKGGGIAVSAVVGGAITNDDKSLDMTIPDSRSQMVGKPKLSIDATSSTSSSSSKKHKQRPDDSKLNTFANLFGTPITKCAPKFSPDPKAKTANGGAINQIAPSVQGKGKDKSSSAAGGAVAGNASSGPVAVSGKDKDKGEKKDKHKQSPHKDKMHDEKESKKKSDGKHDKREEKKKDKKDKEKERDRAKEKPSKRSLSPKSASTSAPSPKRPSPVRSSSAASRDDASAKSSSKTSEIEKRGSSSSSGKKSKKEKKSHDKERDHKEKHRNDVKESVPGVPSVAPAVANTASAGPAVVSAAQPSKTANTAAAPKTDLNSNKHQKASEKDKDSKKTDSKSSEKETTPVQASDKKSSTDKDKKSHKHKKKDKNKEKEKEKEKDKDQPSKKSTSSKDKKDKKDKTIKNEAAIPTPSNSLSKKSIPATEADAPTETVSTKSTSSTVSGTCSTKPTSTTNKQSNNNVASTVPVPNSNTNNTGTTVPASGLLPSQNDLSDVDSLNSESLHAVSNTTSDKAAPIQNSDSSNSSFPELPTAAPKPAPLFQAPANPQPTPPTNPLATAAPAVITEPPRPQATPIVEKKTHRSGAEKSKAEKTAEKEDKKRRRNSTAGNIFVEPPLKQIKKDLKPAREKTQSPLLRTEEKQTFLPPPATTSTLPIQNTPVTALNLEYLSELQELHQKIMTLQDNEELQQVVEMIAATGRYEITSKTFDFDLCKLDRHTVQRLQDFFATSVS